MKRRDRFNIAVALTSVMQAGLNVLIPIAAFVLMAKFLILKFGLTEKIMIFAIIIGVLSGFYNMIKYIYLQISRKG